MKAWRHRRRAVDLVILLTWASSCVSVQAPEPGIIMAAQELIDQGILRLRERQPAKAEASFEAALELTPLPAALDGLGCVAFERGDLRGAEELFWRAYEMDAGYANPLGNLALVYETLGESKLAQRLHRRALQENPENYRFRNNFGAFLFDYTGNKAAAGRELRKAEALKQHPVIRRNLERLGKLPP